MMTLRTVSAAFGVMAILGINLAAGDDKATKAQNPPAAPIPTPLPSPEADLPLPAVEPIAAGAGTAEPTLIALPPAEEPKPLDKAAATPTPKPAAPKDAPKAPSGGAEPAARPQIQVPPVAVMSKAAQEPAMDPVPASLPQKSQTQVSENEPATRANPSYEPNPLPAADSPLEIAETDPEKAAREFLERNQKVADAELAKLQREADNLKLRLQKVESAMRRWEALSSALKRSDGNAAPRADSTNSWRSDQSSKRASLPIIEDAPSSLEPITKAKVETRTSNRAEPVQSTRVDRSRGTRLQPRRPSSGVIIESSPTGPESTSSSNLPGF